MKMANKLIIIGIMVMIISLLIKHGFIYFRKLFGEI